MTSTLCQSCLSNLALHTRMQIFAFLQNHGKQTVSEIVAQTSLSQPTISYHLKNMAEAKLLSKEKSGKAVYYSVNHTCPNSQQNCTLKTMQFTN